MKRRVGLMLMLLPFLLPAAAMAERPGLVVLVWTGRYIQDDPSRNVTGRCPATGCVGDLVTCNASKGMTISRLTYSFVSEICDDKGDELPACKGRFTALAEECGGFSDVVQAGALTTENSAGAIRVCLDSGDCTGARPRAVIATGAIRTQKRWAVESPSVAANSSVWRDMRSSFMFEGRRTILDLWRTFYDDLTMQPNDGGNCDGGCAVVGVSIKDQKQ